MAKKKAGMLNIKWVVSDIGCTRQMRQTIRGLGLRRLQQVVSREDTPAIRGMVDRVRHLVVIIDGGKPEAEQRTRKENTGAGSTRRNTES